MMSKTVSIIAISLMTVSHSAEAKLILKMKPNGGPIFSQEQMQQQRMWLQQQHAAAVWRKQMPQFLAMPQMQEQRLIQQQQPAVTMRQPLNLGHRPLNSAAPLRQGVPASNLLEWQKPVPAARFSNALGNRAFLPSPLAQETRDFSATQINAHYENETANGRYNRVREFGTPLDI